MIYYFLNDSFVRLCYFFNTKIVWYPAKGENDHYIFVAIFKYKFRTFVTNLTETEIALFLFK